MGIPTAEEEALQAPTIDPIWFASLGAGFGPTAAGKMLLQQGMFDTLLQGLSPGTKRASQYAITPRPSMDPLSWASHRGEMTNSGIPYDFIKGIGYEAMDRGNAAPYGSAKYGIYSKIVDMINRYGMKRAAQIPEIVP